MAKGGGFSSGGGFKGGGFGKSSFSGKSFSSFRPSSGARPPVTHTSMHNKNSSNNFLLGTIVGSIINSTKNNRVDTSRNSVFNEDFVNDAPPRPTPRPQEPKYREYKYCEYCQSEFNDMNLTKCPNCGANLTNQHKDLTKPAISNTNSSYNSTYSNTSTQERPKKKGISFWGIFAIIAVVIIAISIFTSGSGVDTEIYKFSVNADPSIVYTHSMGKTISSQYLQFAVTDYYIATEIDDIDCDNIDGMTYVVVKVLINDQSGTYLPIFIRDFSLVYGGTNYQALRVKDDDKQDVEEFYIFDKGSNLSKYFEIEPFATVEKEFVFKIDNESPYDLILQYNEFEDDNTLLGQYNVPIN